MNRPRLALALGAIALAVLVPSSVAGASESAAARQYVRDSAPIEARSSAFEATASSWLGDTTLTNRQAEAAAKPLVSALERLDGELGVQHWPSRARHDVSVLASTCRQLVRDLEALGHVDLSKTSTWEVPLLRDDTASTSAADRVRHDLGLRPTA